MCTPRACRQRVVYQNNKGHQVLHGSFDVVLVGHSGSCGGGLPPPEVRANVRGGRDGAGSTKGAVHV